MPADAHRTVVEAPMPKLQVLAELQRRAARLGADRAAVARRELLARCPTPADLAVEFDPNIVRTPAFDLVSARLAATLGAVDGRLTVSVPPQEMKTTLLRWTCLWALLDDPDRRIVFASYGAALARTSGRIIRGMVETYGGDYGLALDQSHRDAADWQLAGYTGGILAVGVGGSLTGRPSDCMIIDDPHRNQEDADSELMRDKVVEWWEAVARTRLAPGSPAVGVATRWHEQDLISRFIDAGWPTVNIPALSDGDTPDALGRPAGEWLVSTRGRTAGDWQRIRADVGERVWAALYQGRPAPLEGGIFRQAWIDAHRADAAPAELVATTVAIDPADTGQGDAAGILVGSRTTDGHIWVRADLSGQLSQGEWARRALLAAVRFDADTILQESNLGMGRALRDGWSVIRRQAAALDETGRDPAAAAVLLAARGDTAAADTAELGELVPLLDDVLGRPSTGPCHIKAVTPRQSKFVRAHAVTGLYETGRARHVGRLPLLEHEMVTWQPGQPSPNRLDTLAHLLTHLDGARLGGSASVARSRPGRGVPTSTGRDPRRGVMSRGLVRTIGGVG